MMLKQLQWSFRLAKNVIRHLPVVTGLASWEEEHHNIYKANCRTSMDLNKTFESSVEFRLCNQLKVVKLWQGTQGLPSMHFGTVVLGLVLMVSRMFRAMERKGSMVTWICCPVVLQIHGIHHHFCSQFVGMKCACLSKNLQQILQL